MIWTIAALLAAPALAHMTSSDPARTRRHATMLSESCAARNAGLMQSVCPTDPESTQGPYSWPTTAIRQDLRDDPSCLDNPSFCEGTEFTFKLTLVNSTNCETIAGAAIEVWHCSWDGLYSHYLERSMGNLDTELTDNTSFLRAIQYTDDDGVATFTTSFPGWYIDRTWHIHIRVHFNIVEDADGQGYTGGTTAHIGQLYVDDEIVESFMGVAPYNESTVPYTPLRTDWIFNGQGDDFGLMKDIAAVDGAADLTQGLSGSITVGILEEEIEPEVRPGGPPNGGNGNGDTADEGSSASVLSMSAMTLLFTSFITTYVL